MSKKIVQLNLDGFDEQETTSIGQAIVVATNAHSGQLRMTGDPYITHPLAVAAILIELGMDAETVQAAILHDTVEDTDVTLDDLNHKFGPKVAELVDGVTKIGEVDYSPDKDEPSQRAAMSAENVRKLLLAMTKDVRCLIIKLADRTHNLETLGALPPAKQQRIARESLEIYAPLADRLGIGELKTKIEDLSFKYLMPEEYQRVAALMVDYQKTSQRYLARLKRVLRDRLESAGINVVAIDGRQKHLYSVYRKLVKADNDITKIYDLIAVRIIVANESDCYKALGILHQDFKPLIYRIKDYIAVPKPNGYRSLHTTVFALDGRITEIQIRTEAMHEEAERGLAAHFHYNERKESADYQAGKVTAVPTKMAWVNSITSLDKVTNSGQEFVDALKMDVFGDRIFVFSPKGDLYDLPEGATPIDFAFAVHSGLGLRVQGAKVNGRIVNLDAPLSNRDVVDILTRKVAQPRRDWLNSVKTASARNKIRAWFRNRGRADNIISGKTLLESELKIWGLKHLEDADKTKLDSLLNGLRQKDLEGLYAAIGDGTVGVGSVTRRLFPPAERPVSQRPTETIASAVVIEGKTDMVYQLAACCHPVYPQSLVGYVTRGSGVTVHRVGCVNIPDEPDRLMACQWQAAQMAKQTVRLIITARNRIGLLRDITNTVSSRGLNIISITSGGGSTREVSRVILKVEISDLHELAGLVKHIRELPDVTNVERDGS